MTVTQVGTGAQRVVVTDSEGRFSVPGLRAATYDVKAELSGFTTMELKAVTLRSGETVRPSLTLGVGTLNEQITVSGEAPLLQTSSASVGATIDGKMLSDLPVLGNTLLNITTLAPGVSGRQFERNTQYGRRDQFVTVEGGRDSSTNYAIDGVYVRSLRFNNMSLNPPVDFVQEVNILRNSFSTEYGQGQAVVTMVTKSGTNRFSGSASESSATTPSNARNDFATTKPEFRRNQFGVTGGGPVIGNRFFFFGGYEGARDTGRGAVRDTVSDPRWLQGDFSGSSAIVRDPLTGLPFPGNRIPANRIVPFASLQLDTIPIANLPGNANNYRIVRNFTDNTDTLTFRVRPGARTSHTLFQRYHLVRQPADHPRCHSRTRDALRRDATSRPVIPGCCRRPSSTRCGSATTTRTTSPTTSSRAKTISRATGSTRSACRTFRAASRRTTSGGPAPPSPGFGGVVPGTGVFQGATENVYSISNATSKVAGAHNLRFGFQAQYRKFYQSTPVGPRGGFTFNGRATGAANNTTNAFADFLLGYCSTAPGSSARRTRTTRRRPLRRSSTTSGRSTTS